ncbi:hypothetical protein [Pseudodesulfovibrio sp. JC047]|uniref:hypothetical protein n=1 Tax=Pseudodesulfovibrio sp. JC047 TaxID=2683199 RepID=UPI0031BA6A36
MFDWGRLGQVRREMSPAVRYFLEKNPKLNLIDVTNAAHADSGNGHSYFRESPWVSSDVLMTLMYKLSPKDRGLQRSGTMPIWEFPSNYQERLFDNLQKKFNGQK